MTLVAKTRLAKRKQEMQEVRKENQTVTSKKHDKRCIEESIEKNNSVLKLKTLQEHHDNLIEENKNNLIIIKELKEKIATMEIEIRSKETKNSEESQTQTEYEFQEFPCQECVYVASCVEELDWHHGNDHSDTGTETDESDPQSIFSCRICGRINRSKGELMTHRKVKHPQLIRTCRFYVQGICDFPDDVCWISHKVCEKSSSSAPQMLDKFKCGICEQSFGSKSNFMSHRRKEHSEHVSACRDNSNGWCRFGADKCWFKHEEHNDKEEFEKSEMINRLFEMMEKFSKRFEIIENQL